MKTHNQIQKEWYQRQKQRQYIYVLMNKLTGDLYIGKTTNSLNKRFQQHVATAFNERRESPLYRAMRQYGKDNFTITKWITDKTEQELIQELKPQYNKQLKPLPKKVSGKDIRRERNKRIWTLRQEGMAIEALSKRFNLTIRMIYKILDTMSGTSSW